MKRHKGLALALGVGLTVAACDDSFLETIPPDEVSDAIFWTQPKDAELAVNGLYPMNLSNRAAYQLEAASDNAWAQKSFDNWYSIGQGTVTPLNGTVIDFWQDSYQAIRRANEILANIDNIEGLDAALKARLIAETRFHRAYHYNYLVNLFGDVPLILEPVDDIEAAKDATRTPRAQVLAQIYADLDAAAPDLPLTYPAAQYGRATRGAALAYKARAALWANDWAEAEEAAAAVMALNQYMLEPNYHNLTRYAGDESDEIIFADRRTRSLRGQGAFGDYGPRSFQGGSTFTPLRGLVDAYQMEDGLSIEESPLFDEANPYANRDPRMYSTLLYPGAMFDNVVFNSLPSSPTADQVRSDFNATATGYQFIKYVNPEDKNDRGNSGVDFILMRYADVLLMYAEAKIEQNEIDQSVYDAINAVRGRAGMPTFTGPHTQAELREIVRHERRIELAFEGLRLFDIRRWGIAEQVMQGQHFGIDYIDDDGNEQTIPADTRSFDPSRDMLWPIPQSELNLNPELGQNPGY
jgi:starch-binding outer membrane protein, SusD/RagB family